MFVRTRILFCLLAVAVWPACLLAQNCPPATSHDVHGSQPAIQSQKSEDEILANGAAQGGIQTKRIVGIVPNFAAVSADTCLPPLSFKRKLLLATQNSFDYSSFAFAGLQAGIEQATNTYPEFQHGAAGFGRYYWHTFTDQAVGNYVTGAILPAITHEDPRYYTLYHGTFVRRTVYAFSRLWITRKDNGASTFNYSEIIGNGAATAVSSLYYPAQERTNVGGFCLRWATQLLDDGVGNVFTEFWPDLNRKFFQRHHTTVEK